MKFEEGQHEKNPQLNQISCGFSFWIKLEHIRGEILKDSKKSKVSLIMKHTIIPLLVFYYHRKTYSDMQVQEEPLLGLP